MLGLVGLNCHIAEETKEAEENEGNRSCAQSGDPLGDASSSSAGTSKHVR